MTEFSPVSFKDEEEPEPISFKTESSVDVPTPDAAARRAEKYAWTLDKDPADMRVMIESGREGDLRSQIATHEDTLLRQMQLEILTQMAARGGQLAPEDLEIVQSLTMTDMRSDPGTVLEKRFADKYMTQLFEEQKRVLGDNWKPQHTDEVAIGSHIVEQQQWYQKQTEDIEARISKQGWLSWGLDVAAQTLPFLPWWRQANALKDRPGISFLMGDTMDKNVVWLRAQPFDVQKQLFKQAMDYLEPRNKQDALLFAKAMHSFGSSDYMLGNVTSLADYSIIGPLALKLGRKLFGSAKVAPKRDPLEIVGGGKTEKGDYLLGQDMYEFGMQGPIRASKWVPPAERARLRPTDMSRQGDLFNGTDYSKPSPAPWAGGVKGRDEISWPQPPAQLEFGFMQHPIDLPNPLTPRPQPRTVGEAVGEQLPMGQLDLFGPQPEQGAFRFQNRPTQSRPPNEAEVPGRLRATFEPYAGRQGSGEGTRSFQGPYRDALGRMRRQSRQEEFDFGPRQGDQLGLPLSGQTPSGGPQTQQLRGPAPQARAAEQLSLDLGEPPQQRGFQFQFNTPREPVTKGKVDYGVPFGPKEYKREILTDSSVKRAVADAVRAVEDPAATPVTILSTMGDVKRAGVLGALERLGDRNRGLVKLANEVPSIANPSGFLRDSQVIHRERAQALGPQLEGRAAGLIEDYLRINRVSRMTPEAQAAAYKIAEQALYDEVKGRVQHALLDTKYTPKELMQFVYGTDKATNTDFVTLVLGKTDKTLFDSKEQAELYARDVYKLGDRAEAVQHGRVDAWQLEIHKTVKETDDLVRDGMINNGSNKPNVGMVNTLLYRIRSAADIVSKFQRGNRSIATHSPREMEATLQREIDRDISSLPAASRRAVEDILRDNRDMPNPMLPGERGWWYKTAGEFERAFIKRHKRPPTEKEIIAYDTYVRLSDFDYVMRNTTVYRDKSRLGIETFSFSFADGKSPWFEGVEMKAFPWKLGRAGENDYEAGIWLYDSEKQSGRFMYKHAVTPDTKKEIDDLIANQGYRVVQVFDAAEHPLKGIAKRADGQDLQDQVHYIITNTWDKKALEWHQVDYRPGAHVIYPKEWYVAQPVIKEGWSGKLTMFGDNVALNVETRAEAEKWAARMDHARVLFKELKEAELADYVKKNLPYSLKEFKELFIRSDSPFSVDHPITIKERNKSTFDSNAGLKASYKDVVEAQKSPYNLSNWMDRSFLADRDNVLKTVKEGPHGALTLEAAEQLDPFEALQRAVAQEIRNVWMNDYKISAIESWIQEFSRLGAFRPGMHVLNAHPTFFLYHPEWNDNIQKDILAAAKAQQQAIVTFLGTQSELGEHMTYLQHKVMDSLYNKAGQKGLNALTKVGKATESVGLANIKDPATFLRSIAVHSKLGMFNPVHLIVNAQSLFHTLALSPMHATQGLAGGQLARYYYNNPNHIDALAKVAGNMGWKPDVFKEMAETMRNSGVLHVGGEVGMWDDVFDPKLFRSKMATWLDKGMFFFKASERAVRTTAFATAFHEWRATNPTRQIGTAQLGEIMDRYRTLAVDMTRDANAAWQSGLLSVPTTFFTYNARMFEQLWGGRLTGWEKFRVFSLYSALYGVPVSVGAWTMGVSPLGWAGVPTSYEDIKAYAFENGINISEGFLKSATEGLMSLGLEMLTGRQYNTAARFGPGASTAISEWFKGDKPLWEIAGGAPGTIISDTIKAAYPLLYYASSIFSGDQHEYPITKADWFAPMRNISSIDIGAKAYMAINYGKWYTKTGTAVGDADGLDAMLSFLGLTRQDLSDTYIKMGSIDNIERFQKPFAQSALRNWRAGLQAAANGDYKLMNVYFTRANTDIARGNFSLDQQTRLFRQGMNQGIDLKDKINWDLVRKSKPTNTLDIMKNIK